MKLFGRTFEGFAKVLVVLLAIFFVAGGLCGLTLGLNGGWFNGSNTALTNFVVAASVISGIGVVLSFLGIVIVLVVLLVRAVIRNSSGKPKDDVQKLFDSDRNGEGKNPL
jgi:hypothetical protein